MSAARGYVGPIPVQNIWWLMLYASELYRVDAGTALGGSEPAEADVADLVGRILNDCVTARLQRQLTPRFTYRAQVLRSVRGRIDVLRTVRRSLLQQGAVACRYPVLSVDTQTNRLVRAALAAIAELAPSPQVGDASRTLARRLLRAGVSAVPPTRTTRASNRMSRAGFGDRQMLAAARLALDLALPVEGAGRETQRIPDRTVEHIRHLFERAVGGFYRTVLEREGWTVRTGRRLDWPLDRDALTPWLRAALPGMQTDIVLDAPGGQRRIVIDTKFNAIVTSTWHRAESLRNGYLYQIYAYLQTQVGRGDLLADRAEGLLLHPSTGAGIDECIRIQGHRIRFATVDLAASGPAIRAQLLRAIASADTPQPVPADDRIAGDPGGVFATRPPRPAPAA
ncbi:MAG TPA: 5-methylcytosine-specific restriction endonuclease system specificity protein McrC [Nevskiaceae bacterium]